MARGEQSSFTSGELTPSLHRRPTLEKFLTGLKTCYNMFVHPHGGASNRPGTEFIVEVKYSDKATKVIEFAFNVSDTYCLEVGDQYIRVIRSGGQVLLSATPAAWVVTTAYIITNHVSNGGVNYYCHEPHTSTAADEPGVGANWEDYWYALIDDIVEIPTPYLEAELFDIKFVQSADIITITHPNHPPSELARYDHDEWTLTEISFVPAIEAPTGVSGTGGAGTSFNYVVTAISEDTAEESVASSSAAMLEDGGILSWTAVTGAESYAIYKEKNGVYGFIGTAVGTSFEEEKFLPEFDDTPPLERNPFTGVGNYPSNVTYHEQRLCFANSLNKPQNIWMSQTGNFHNFNVSSPSKSDDAITLRIDAAQVNAVRNLVSLEDLLVLTSGAVHKITSGDNAFAFENLRTKPQAYRGVANVESIVIDNTVLYIQARGSSVRDIGYTLESDGYKGQPLSILSEHLVKYHTLVDWGYAQEPDSVIWAVREDGVLLGITYLKEQEVLGWHRHQTDGLFESICIVEEGQEDSVYFVVKRTVNGVVKRYIERLHTRKFDNVKQAFFVDCGLSYVGDEENVIDIIKGTTTKIYIDGFNLARRTQQLAAYDPSDWTSTSCSLSDLTPAINYPAPDGSHTVTYVGTVSGTPYELEQLIPITTHANRTFTFSCYMAKDFFTEHDIYLEIKDGASAVIASQANTVIDHVNYTIPVVRYSVTGTFGASPAANMIISINSPTGNFGANNFVIWGVLVNLGSKPGSYIDGGAAGVGVNPFTASQDILIQNVDGMTEINGNHETISAVSYNEVDIATLDSTTFTDYVESGKLQTAIDAATGLDHLEGKEVAILADGNVHPRKTVSGGAITLDYLASELNIGLPYMSDLETLEPPLQGTSGLPKQASDLIIGVLDSRGIWAGPTEDNLTELKQRESEAWGDPTELKTGYFRLGVASTWKNNGQLLLRQVDPLPVTILSVVPDYDVGS